MSSSGITFSGLASGLDTQSIIQALLQVEQRPIQQLERNRAELRQQQSLFGDINGQLESLAEAAQAISRTGSFLDFQAAVDNEDFLTATASNSASSGSYTVSVDSIARARVAASDGFASATEAVGTGTILVDLGDGNNAVAIVEGSGTLQDIANALNDVEGLRANVVDTGNPTDPFQLVVSATEPGAENSFNLSLDLASDGLTSFVEDLQADTTVPATDAQVTIDGITISRSSNQITDAIPGVTLDLVSADPNTTTQLTVTTDAEATSERVQEFVDSYNSIVDFIEAQSALDEEGNASSPLFGDSTLRTIRSNLRSVLSNSVDTGNQGVSLLSQIGIDSDTQGRLTFNRGEFEEALVEDEGAVRDFFTLRADDDEGENGFNPGIALRIFEQIDVFTDSIDGLIKARTDGIESRTRSIDDSIRRAEDRLERLEQSLTARFANLEVLTGRLQSQGGAVNSIGAGLGG